MYFLVESESGIIVALTLALSWVMLHSRSLFSYNDLRVVIPRWEQRIRNRSEYRTALVCGQLVL